MLSDEEPLNEISLVPSGSAEHIPYMVYLARGRDVDTPAVVVLLDGDAEALKIRDELRKGYRGKRYVDDDLVIQTSDISPASVAIASDVVREIEDLIPSELAVLAIHRFAGEVLPSPEAGEVVSGVTSLAPQPGEKLYRTAQAICAALPQKLRLDKVGFARAVLESLEHAPAELVDQTLGNFEELFSRISKAQRDALRRNSRERVRHTIARFNRAFVRDHPSSAKRQAVLALLEDIEGQLVEVTDETEQVRADVRLIRADFKLTEEPESLVEDFGALTDRLNNLQYVGVRNAQH